MFTTIKNKYLYTNLAKLDGHDGTIPLDWSYFNCISDDNSLFLVLEINSNNKLVYHALKIDIPRERAKWHENIYKVSFLELNNEMIKLLKSDQYTYITSVHLTPTDTDYVQSVLQNINDNIELYEGRAYFLARLLKLERRREGYIFQNGINRGYLNEKLTHLIEAVGLDEQLAPSRCRCIKHCIIL